MTWDILIRRGTVIDGGGSPGTIGDIALAAGRIAALAPSLAGDANKVIDADGLAVTPGFMCVTQRLLGPLNRLLIRSARALSRAWHTPAATSPGSPLPVLCTGNRWKCSKRSRPTLLVWPSFSTRNNPAGRNVACN